MTKAVNAWAIHSRDAGLLLHSVGMSQFDAWARLNLNRNPDDPMRSPEEYQALGFRAVQVRVKYDEPTD